MISKKFNQIELFIQTVKYLRFKQVFYRVFYFVFRKLFKKNFKKKLNTSVIRLKWENVIFCNKSYLSYNKFTFLNEVNCFSDKIDWNYRTHGKLWTYNLNYFDFLNQKYFSVEIGLELIRDYLLNEDSLEEGKDSYPISLRGINWIKFLSINKIDDTQINQNLYNDYQILLNNLEYHILGNHLLENGFSLLFGAFFFDDKVLYNKARQIIFKELEEQILKDGGHFELSPMYHQIILHRLLDCINLERQNHFMDVDLYELLKDNSKKMLSWLSNVTFKNGQIPMVNDSTFEIAPSSKDLFYYASMIGLEWNILDLSDSGYRIRYNDQYELFMDVGNIGPDYQPGHAHADTFNFILNIGEKPFITEVGVSTYEKNKKRHTERSTESHNTVKINRVNQSNVWGGFRVGQRAKILNLDSDENKIRGLHDGYKKLGVIHKREFLTDENEVKIIDDLISLKEGVEGKAYLHFHPSITNVTIEKNSCYIKEFNSRISFFGDKILSVLKQEYFYAIGFNRRQRSEMIVVSFQDRLITEIEI